MKILFMIAIFLLNVGFAFSVNAENAVHHYTLENGLQVLVKVDRRSPMVVSQIWYRVGASDELTGQTGLSHMLEHLMFKGTTRYGPGEYSRLLSENGATENAFTSYDYTAYYAELENSRLALHFELEADRMQNLLLLEEELMKERQVILEERSQRVDDNPTAAFSERLKATALMTSPYRDPIIGWRSDIEQYQRADLLLWYQHWYAPNHATLVVVGDVQPEEVHELAVRYFGDIPATNDTPLTLKKRDELSQRGKKQMTVKLPAKMPVLSLLYQVPSLVVIEESKDWEIYALILLANILDGNDSSRLPKSLVRGQEIATYVSVNYDPLNRYHTLFNISAAPTEKYSVFDLEKAIAQEINRLHNELVSTEELNRVKTQLRAQEIYSQDSLFYQAMRLGMIHNAGLNWQLLDTYLARIAEITPEQIQSVALRYLQDDLLTVGYLEPQAMASTTSTVGE
ncbi:M16 family metallopeptidase [Thioflexithrix psekupsensis]|uniref:Peptidase M16 n=1 Tax=Thioflexithrix psekupsensis TaxID=1570016 RepID=A0A251X4U1_9GAMM|nr:pitrilysin family protein [Thioflexithrix psekupsensis]OUD12441.1 hypothetical protein TPSD3_15140 [Thioflexithrix psekupsensis]